MKLIHKSAGKVVREGDTVTNFRGEKGIVLGWTKPHSPASTGRITVYVQGIEHSCYPEVYSCEWIDREDRETQPIGDPIQAIYGFSQPTPVGGLAPSLPSVSSFDRTAELMAKVEEQFKQIQETLNEIKRILS